MKILSFLVLFLIVCQNGCSNPSGATKTLQQNGYTNIRITGHAFFCCGEDYVSTGFIATSPSGVQVEGCVCEDLLMKAKTIRFR